MILGRGYSSVVLNSKDCYGEDETRYMVATPTWDGMFKVYDRYHDWTLDEIPPLLPVFADKSRLRIVTEQLAIDIIKAFNQRARKDVEKDPKSNRVREPYLARVGLRKVCN
jgi:hypothetical protein